MKWEAYPVLCALLTLPGLAQVGAVNFRASLDGYSEVPAISTAGKGVFRATLSSDGTSLSYELEYSGLTANAQAAHVHLGRPGTSGGVMFFLCGGGTKPACPGLGGSVSGTVVAGDIVAIPSQGLAAGDFAAALAAMRAGAAYVNVHTTQFPGGEIRGQIQPGRGPRTPESGRGGGPPGAEGQAKVLVCHYDKQDNKWFTIEVAQPAVDAHLKRGDCLNPAGVVGQACSCP